MDGLFSFLKVLAICTAAVIGLTLVLAVVVSDMPADNPLRRFLGGLTRHLGVTAGLTVLGVPVNAVFDEIGVGEIYDAALVIFLCFYWFRFFKSQYEASSGRRVGEIRVTNVQSEGTASWRKKLTWRTLSDRLKNLSTASSR